MLLETETCVGESKHKMLMEKQFLKKQEMNKSFSHDSKYSR